MARFRKNGSRIVEVDLSGESVKALTGAMIAYEGDISFKKAGFGGGEGVRGALKRKVTGESLDLMECAGSGTVYFAHAATEIELVPLANETLQVESSSLLAVDSGLKTNVTFTGLRGATAGQGLFTTTVSGNGVVALLSDGPAISLEVAPQYPLVVDPDAYVASKGQLTQSFVTDVSWRSAVGKGSGEAFSLRFDGSGVVLIQPAER